MSKLWMVGRQALERSSTSNSLTASSTLLLCERRPWVAASLQICRREVHAKLLQPASHAHPATSQLTLASCRNVSMLQVSERGRLNSRVSLMASRLAWMRHSYRSSTYRAQDNPECNYGSNPKLRLYTFLENFSKFAIASSPLVRKFLRLSEVHVTCSSPGLMALSTCSETNSG